MKYPVHDAVIKWAEGELGTSEVPPGSNTGPRVRFYQAHTWLGGTGWPWCAAFAATAWEVGGKRKLPWPSAGAWDLGNRGRKQGWAVSDPSLMRPGDLVVFKAGAGHVALFASYDKGRKLVKTIDGNVANAVVRRARPLSAVRDLIHIPEKGVKVEPAKAPVFEVVTSEDGQKIIYVSGARAIGRNLARFLRVHPRLTIRRRKK